MCIGGTGKIEEEEEKVGRRKKVKWGRVLKARVKDPGGESQLRSRRAIGRGTNVEKRWIVDSPLLIARRWFVYGTRPLETWGSGHQAMDYPFSGGRVSRIAILDYHMRSCDGQRYHRDRAPSSHAPRHTGLWCYQGNFKHKRTIIFSEKRGADYEIP